MKRVFLFLITLSMAAMTAAQDRHGMTAGGATAGRWEHIDTLMVNAHFATAYPLAQGYYREALASGTGPEMLTAAFYLTIVDYAYSKDAIDSALARYGFLARRLQGVDRAVAYAFLSSTYNHIYSLNYYHMNRNKASDDPKLKYNLWHRQRMADTLQRCADSVLAYADALRTAPIEPYGRLFRSDSILLPPLDSTLLGMLVHTLLSVDYLHLGTGDIPPTLRDGLFKPLPQFAQTPCSDPMPYPLGIHHHVAQLYADSSANGKMLWLDLKRMNLFYPDSTFISSIENLARHYAGVNDSELKALLAFRHATYLSYDQQKVKAEEVCLATERAYPGTYGARRCRHLRQYDICLPQYELNYQNVESSQRSRMACVESRNIQSLNFRLVDASVMKAKGGQSDWLLRDTLMSLTPVKEWQQPLPDSGDHLWHRYLIALPPVPQGDYYLVAYTDSNFCYGEYQSADASFILYDTPPAKEDTWLFRSSGHLVDRITGQPLAGNRVTLHGKEDKIGRNYNLHRHTDKEGYFHFPSSSPRYKSTYDIELSANVEGYEFYYSDYDYGGWLYYGDYYYSQQTRLVNIVMTDRPTYRLGDTVRFCCVAYRRHTSGRELRQHLRPAKNLKLVARFGRPHEKDDDTLYLTTDGHGRCHGEFVIPTDGRNGRYVLSVESPDINHSHTDPYYTNKDIIVEAYKPPHFMVTLSRYPDSTKQKGPSVPQGTTAFGQPVTLYGSAVSYSGAPMQGAVVKWEVSCEEMSFPPSANTVANEFPYGDSLVVDADGLFQFTFTPERPGKAGTYIYTAYVRVMDADGELHEQHLSFHVSDADGYCMIAGNPRPGQTADLCQMDFVYNDFDGHPLEGSVQVELFQLQQPDTVRTLASFMKEYPETRWADPVSGLSDKASFHRHFPYCAYSREEGDRHSWPVVAKRFSTVTTGRTISIPGLPSGLYRVTFRTPDGYSYDTLVNYVAREGRVTGDDIVWMRTTPRRDWTYYNSLTCRMGDTVRIELGSPYGNQPLYYRIMHASKVYRRGMMVLDSNHVSTLLIPITRKIEDGCVVQFSALREGRVFATAYNIKVERPDRNLDISTETFRDRLQPGAQEQWTFRVANATGDVNMSMTLYDQSLEQYRFLQYGFQPWIYPSPGRPANIEVPQIQYIVPSTTVQYSLLGNQLPSPALGFSLHDQKSYYGQLLHHYGQGGFRGTVVDSKTREPLPFVTVRVSSNNRQIKGTSTDLDGNFVFQNLPLGIYNVEFLYVGYQRYIRQVVINGKNPTYWNVPLQCTAIALDEVQIVANKNRVIEIGEPAYSSRISSEDIVRMPPVAAVGGIGYSDGTSSQKRGGVDVPKSAIAEISPMFNFDGSASDSPVALRKNLSTLAFFEPALNSDKEGRVTVSFTLPDALTQWRLHGFAWSDKFQTGSITRTVHSQKELMVQPLLPRFLRQGDTVVIPAKVSNLTDSTLAVKVDFSFESLANSQFLDLPPHSSALATMRLAIPESWQSATYKILARNTSATGRHLSDGEQGSLPVLSNRERITTSHLLYLPGSADGKEVTRTFSIVLPSIAEGDSTLLSFTANPIDYAIQALPHFKRHRMPGNIYLANSIYVDHLTALLDTLTPKEKQRVESRVMSDLSQLLHAQLPQGGWSWMPGGKTASRYVTETVLQRLSTCPSSNNYELRYYRSALNYLDRILADKYADARNAPTASSARDILSLLYTRSLYLSTKPLKNCDSLTQEAYRFYCDYCKANISGTSPLYAQGQLALLLLHSGDTAGALRAATSIKEAAHTSDAMGMYWLGNTSGYGWYQRPVETAALMVDVFAHVLHDWESVNRIQQWILASKQGSTWRTDMATAHALAALLTQPEGLQVTRRQDVSIRCNGTEIESGIKSQSLNPQSTTLDFQLSSTSPLPAFGAVFHSHDTPMDSIEYNGTGMALRKTLSRVGADGSLTSLSGRTQEYAPTLTLQAGERIRVHVDIDCERDFDNMVLRDQRAAAFEPASTASGWQWNDGLRYYVDVRDEGVNCYIDHLGEGHYYVEYDLWVRHSGTFSGGICTLHSVYAPEFRANSPSEKITTEGR